MDKICQVKLYFRKKPYVKLCPIRVCQCAESVQNHYQTPLSPLFWSQRFHQVKNNQKNLMLEGDPSAPKFCLKFYHQRARICVSDF